MNDKELSPEVCREYGKKFLAHEWWEDAWEFFRKGGLKEEMDQLLSHCLETGDAYLLQRLGKHDPEVWRQVAHQALKLGKKFFAWQALKQAGEHEQAELLAQELKEAGWLHSP